jgi:hypothetical protein
VLTPLLFDSERFVVVAFGDRLLDTGLIVRPWLYPSPISPKTLNRRLSAYCAPNDPLKK